MVPYIMPQLPIMTFPDPLASMLPPLSRLPNSHTSSVDEQSESPAKPPIPTPKRSTGGDEDIETSTGSQSKEKTDESLDLQVDTTTNSFAEHEQRELVPKLISYYQKLEDNINPK